MDFYFDYLSPYAYFAWRRVRQLRIEVHPVLFAGLLNHFGHKGPAEIPSKRAFVIKDALRYAKKNRFEFTFPARHPFNPVTALRLSLKGPDQIAIIDAIWEAGWVRGEDIGDIEVLESALDNIGLDGAGCTARTRDPAVKTALREQTENAIARGVFGIPTFIVEGELFWGNDRVDDVLSALAGEDPLDRVQAEKLISAPYGDTR